MLLFGLPLAVVSGALIVSVRVQRIISKPFNDLSSPYDCSIWARQRIIAYERNKLEMQRLAAMQVNAEGVATQDAAGHDSDDERHPGEDDSTPLLGNETGVRRHSSHPLGLPLQASGDCTRLLQQVTVAYRTMATKFDTNGLALMEVALFFQFYANVDQQRPSHFLELSCLNAARRASSALVRVQRLFAV